MCLASRPSVPGRPMSENEASGVSLGAVDEPSALPLRPFLRWAGSKRLLLNHLLPLVPKKMGTYFEPFLGGGSLFLAVRPSRAELGDSLEPLVLTWNRIRDDLEGVLAHLENWQLDRQTYLTVRDLAPESSTERAAQFLFLNRGAYGGLWRLNRQGRFNVPWSQPKTASPVNEANLRSIAHHLGVNGISPRCADFAVVTSQAQAGDFVFLDPPYSKGRKERPFVHYNESLFSWADQIRLASEAARLQSIGVTVVVTNSTHADVEALYPTFSCVDIRRHSSLGSHVTSTREITERIYFSD